ncbi:putative F420-dependent oxidoreductase, Rv2161c family [Frankia sp. EI5c]|uniref:LLM class F420-dependent oxidoreductase n=1 Tax=Frankia sp. EI5c TaxID=683316 RepID=UPI0007C2BFE6|nr:LLM class F420-dependent oxidoreductase [Frankia sp. EI5c]OAA27358.1 putative F420-dependent oxidoreductase, Rv2161c family [Frankia sp. EI5c]
MTMFGLLTPVLSLVPGSHAEWERDGGIDDVRRIAEAADGLGYDYLTCSEHVAIPTRGAGLPGPCYWDPLATFGYLAAHTTRIRFTTSVLVLGYHHPLDIAKRYGTLDRICGGRLNLGLGVGYLEPEFRLLGVPFEGRGARADDAIRALRASFGRPEPSYDGPHYRFDEVIVEPCGAQTDIPMWIGGRTPRSLRRAVALGDGWYPFAVSPGTAAEWLAAAARTDEWQRRRRPLDVILGPARPIDPLGEPDEARLVVRALLDAGATGVSLRFVHRSLAHYLEQLEAMRSVIVTL